MDHEDRLRSRLQGAAAWLDASPTEVVGLLVLLLGAVAAAGVLWWTGRPAPPAAAVVAAPSAPATADTVPPAVTVHVAGAVATPGLVTLGAGARVADALAAAGGPAVDADLGPLNLARVVSDGERIRVPVVGEPVSSGGTAGATAAVTAGAPLDLNTASADELEQLPGIGPVLAARIVAHRERLGRFADVGQLRDVPGIGEKTFQSLADRVRV